LAVGRLVYRRPLAALGLQGLAATFGNVGYMGLPILLTAFGPPAILPSVLIVVTDIAVTVSLAVALAEAGIGRAGRRTAVARTVFLGLARNPLLGAVLAGALLSVAGAALPAPVRAFGNLLGAAALPCALFALGGSLVGGVAGARAGEVAVLVGPSWSSTRWPLA
jgi:malonate transporter